MCVSTLKTTLYCSSKRTTPALSSKDADAPVVVAGVLADLLGGGEDRLAEHVLEAPLAASRRDSGSARRASCGCNARSRSGPRSPARRRSGRGRACGNGPGWSASRPATGRAAPRRLSRPGPRRPSRRMGTVPGGTGRASRPPGARNPAGRRWPARWRRWPALRSTAASSCPPAGRRSSIFEACGRPRPAEPKSAMAEITLWATGSITPGLGSTWTTSPRRRGRRLATRHRPPGRSPSARRRGRPTARGRSAPISARSKAALDQVAAWRPHGQTLAKPQSAASAATWRASMSGVRRPDRCQFPRASRFFLAAVRNFQGSASSLSRMAAVRE